MSGTVRMGTPAGRGVLLAAVLGSGLAGLDATVVNVALPTIGRDLDAGFRTLQWTVTAYTLTLAAFVLLGGSLGDRLGRRRIFVFGVVWFALASLLCGFAPSAGVLLAARALQGLGAALMVPASLAMIQASFTPEDRGRAIGAWSGLGGLATALGPFVGGWLVESASWRWAFLINPPLAVLVVVVALRCVPESRGPGVRGRVDLPGATLAAVGLAGVTYALIEPGSVTRALAAAIGAAGLVGFLLVEHRSAHPMLPLGVFRSRQLSAANAVTFVVYAVIGGVFFLLAVHLQVVAGLSPVQAGSAVLPVTALMLLLSARAGQLAQQIGPRRPMAAGPLVVAAALALMLRIDESASYVTDVLPAVVALGLGLSLLVAPLTATALAAADPEHAGLASGVNNAVARAAALLAVAVLPAAAGLGQDATADPTAFLEGFRVAMGLGIGLLVVGAVLAALTISDDVLEREEPTSHCAVAAPPQAVGTARRD